MKKPLKRYFIPHEGNDYKPHILQRTAVVMMSLLVLLTFAFANMQALLWMNSNWLVSTILPSIIVELTNDSRGGQALGSLERNAVLDQAAQLKAQHMAENSYFAHYAPDGTSPWYFFDSVSYDYMHAGENLAVHFSDSDEVVDAWLESPSHRENIMNGKYTQIGVGTAKGEYQGYPTVFVVQLFGTPMAQPVAVKNPEPPQRLALAAEEVSVQPVVIEPEVLSEPVVLDPVPSPVLEPAPTPAEIAPLAEAEPDVNQILLNENDSVTLVSDTEETSQAVAGIELSGVHQLEQQPVSSLAKLATQPQRLLNSIYLMTSLFVMSALIMSVFIEIRRQHPVQIAYGTGLIAAMIALMYIHIAVTSGALIA